MEAEKGKRGVDAKNKFCNGAKEQPGSSVPPVFSSGSLGISKPEGSWAKH